MKKTGKDIIRQRIKPRIWDYSFFLLKNNLKIFLQFREIILTENKKKILDIGCGFKPWERLFEGKDIEYIGIDTDENSLADIRCSAEKLPFPDNTFDAIICSETLEHILEIDKTILEIKRVSKNGAILFISTPFIFPEHGIPFDYQRFTKYFFQKIFSEDEIILISESNTSLTTFFLIPNLLIENIFPHLFPFSFIKMPIYIFLNFIGIVIEFLLKIALSPFPIKYRKRFFGFPLGYALIVKIKK